MDIGAFEVHSTAIATTTGVGSSLNASTYGQSVTFTATVSDTNSAVPTGSVEFFDGSNDLGAGTPLGGSGQTATWTLATSTLFAGIHSISAVYTPTGTFTSSTGGLSQTVNTATLTITANDDSKTYGTLKTFSGSAFMETGLVTANGDTITGVTETSTGASTSAPVGTDPIIPSTATGSGLSNYTIAYVNGTKLTVRPRRP